jgi:magnesium transporter
MIRRHAFVPNKLLTKRRNRYNIFHRPPPGSSPGTVIDPIDPTPTRLALMAYDQDKLDARDLDDIPGLSELVKSHQVTWISVIGLGKVPLIQKLCQELGIHRLTVEDIINQYQRPKVEYFDTYSFITVHIPRLDARNESEHVSIIIGQGFVVSFQNSPIDYMESIRNRIQKKVGQIRFKGCDYLCYAIIDAVIDLYFPIAEYFAHKLELAEEEVVHALKPAAILDIYDIGSRLNYFHRILWSHKELLTQLIRDPESPINEDVTVYMRDCFDHTIQILDFLENQKDSSKTLISLHLSLQTHHSNEVMKFLTIITATFIPMTFITGLYGMNFNRASKWNMPELDWLYGYPFALSLMILSAGSLWLYFYRRRWFATAPATRGELESEQKGAMDGG